MKVLRASDARRVEQEAHERQASNNSLKWTRYARRLAQGRYVAYQRVNI